MSDIQPVRVLFVCMGNICRSPTAHGIFEALVASHGLQARIQVDSAGTHGYHVGTPPDPRAQATARARGVDLSTQRARRFESRDFLEFDYVIGMDRGNLADMLALRPDNPRAEASLMLDFADEVGEMEVPDPYYGDAGFERVYDLIDSAATGLLSRIRERYAF
ncbi:MAG: low molecular weight protein-tyrosine-phosphatase [Gammaproteobacteria bacterium]|nr:low molecular weight protein-tyrosine-phosphatase [Gammaproteobacteria bacterium]